MNTFAPAFARRAFSVSQDRPLDPFLSSPIPQRASTLGEDSSLTFDTTSSLYASDSLGLSVPRSTANSNTSVSAPFSTNPHLANSKVTSVNQLAPMMERIKRFDISDDTFHILDSIDPTFWSLETYIQTCARISLESKQMLPLGYYASLVLLTKVLSSSESSTAADEESVTTDQSMYNKSSKSNDSTYYYDKSAFVRHPLKISRMLRDALETIQGWMQENEYSMSSSTDSGLYSPSSSTGFNSPTLSTVSTDQHEQRAAPPQYTGSSQQARLSQLGQHVYQAQILEDLRLTVSRFIFVLDQVDKNNSDVECYQSSNWPNASSADKFVRYFPLFDSLLPVKSTSEKVLTCLNAFLPQLEGLMGTQTLDSFEIAYLYQTSTAPGPQYLAPWWMEVLIKKVEAWQVKKNLNEGSPRKRSFTVMDDDVVGHFRRPSDAMRGRPKKLRRPSL